MKLGDAACGGDGPGRYVAVWENIRKRGDGTNTLAFEAELHPSDGGKFAPKTFCVAVGLCDSDHGGQGREHEPSFAIPLGFANLVITGEETLDGQPLQIDLPLTKANHFVRNFGSEKAFPLLELGDAHTQQFAGSDHARDEGATNNDKPPKKKTMVSRIFSRAKGTTPAPYDADEAPAARNETPQSIFQLGRPPTAEERQLFLESFNIDPSGDAVIRIGLEVFERGSELEQIFRQRNRVRRERRKAEAFAASALPNNAKPNVTGSSLGPPSRSVSSGTGKSLVDEEILESESDYSDDDSPSYFSLDSGASGTTWDESTMYTSETDTSYTSKFVNNSSAERGLQFGRMFACKMESFDKSTTAAAVATVASSNSRASAVVPIQFPAGIFSCGSNNLGKRDFYDRDDAPKGKVQMQVGAREKHIDTDGTNLDDGVKLGNDIFPETNHDPDTSQEVTMDGGIVQKAHLSRTCEQLEQMEGLELTLDDVRIS